MDTQPQAKPTKERRQYKLDQRRRLNPEPPFTLDHLGAIFSEEVGGLFAVPGALEIKELCGILNLWHQFFYRAQEERSFNDSARKAQTALHAVAALMPGILSDLERRRALSNGADQFSVWKMNHALSLANCLNPTSLGFLQPYDLPDQAKDWRWLIAVLPADIEIAMKTKNPLYVNALTEESFLMRVLAAVIPELTGETPTPGAVRNQIKNANALKSLTS